MIPDSIPVSLWDEFRKHRKKLKAPMTDHAESLILAKLEKWKLENGVNPIDVINESIEKGWRGVFLNGHGKKQDNQSLTNGARDKQITVSLCCSCGGSLEAGFVHTSKGKRCHAC